jgi:hypothetical protein
MDHMPSFKVDSISVDKNNFQPRKEIGGVQRFVVLESAEI